MLIVLARRKRVLIFLPLVSMIITAVASMFVADVYRSSATLLPPQQAQSSAAALLSQLGGMGGLAAGVAGIKSPNDLYIGMLQSRTLTDTLINRFALKKEYETESLEKARKKLAENTAIATGKDGLITISVEGERKPLVTQLANAYVDELMKLTRTLAVTEASQRRLFFERQLEDAKNNLAKAEMTLKANLDTHGVVSVDANSRAIVETIGRLRAQVSAKEIELNAMDAFVTTNNPNYQRVAEQLKSLRAELNRLENGRPSSSTDTPLTGAGLENIKSLRDVKYYQMLYELLAKQYEAARLDEAKDPGVIQVLDRAVEPERNVKPRRLLIVFLAGVIAIFAAILWIVVTEMISNIRSSPGGASQLEKLKRSIRSSK